MRGLKEFREYLKKGVVRKKSPDNNRAKDLVDEAERKYNSLKVILDKIGINDQNANDLIESCYDILIRLARAKMLVKGFYSSGLGAHEAEVSYLREMNISEEEVSFMNQLRYFRNSIMYYGKRFDKEYAKKVINFLEKMYLKLE